MIGSDLGAGLLALALIATGVLMLASVVRGVPKSPAIGAVRDDGVLVATKVKKKSKGKA